MLYESVTSSREATPLLPITSGCSHNQCGFCNMYRSIPFKVYSPERIRSYLKEIQKYDPRARRIFLVGGDPFVLKADKLLNISDEILEFLPCVKTITMYASVKNIINKTDEELRRLRQKGIDQLYIGLETGWDELLTYLNKGSTAREAVTQLNRLTDAGMTYGVIIMTGLAGQGKGVENAEHTAALMNQIQARVLYCNSSLSWTTPSWTCEKNGTYVEAGEYERIEELLALIKALNPPQKLLVNLITFRTL